MVGDHGNGLEVLPPDPKTWSIEDVCQWLIWKHLGQYTEVFRTERVDGAALLCLDRECARELIPTMGPRLILLKELNALLKSSAKGASDLLKDAYGSSNGHGVNNGIHPASTILEDVGPSSRQDPKAVSLQQAGIGNLEDEVRTLNQTLQKFVQVLRDPSASQTNASEFMGQHLRPVNLETRYAVETEGVAGEGGTTVDILGDEGNASPCEGRGYSAPEEGEEAEGLRQHGAACEESGAGSRAECSEKPQLVVDEQPADEHGRASHSRSHSDGQSSQEGTSHVEEATHRASELDGGSREDLAVQGANEVGDEPGAGLALQEQNGSRTVTSDLTISIDANADERIAHSLDPGSSSSRAGSSGSQDPSAARARDGLLYSPGPPGPSFSPHQKSPDKTPGSRRGGIPRSRSNTSLRQNGGRENRRHSSFEGGLLGRHPHEYSWQPPSPDQHWQCMPPSPQDGFFSPGGHFPEPYPVYGSAPEVMYMPVLMPGYPTSPGWGVEAPPFFGSPGPAQFSPPVQYLDRTTSEGALLPPISNGLGAPEPSHQLTRRASLGSRRRALRSPGRGHSAQGQDSPADQQGGSAALSNSPSPREVSPNSRGLLGSSPQSRSDVMSRPHSAVSNDRSPHGCPPYYTHPHSSRSMQDLESAWVENQQAHPYQLSPGNGGQLGPWSVGEGGEANGAYSPNNDPQSHSSGTGYFMPSYQNVRKQKSRVSTPAPKPAQQP